MQARQFEDFLKQLPALTRRQRQRVLGLLAPAAKRDEAAELIEQCRTKELASPGCGCRHFHKHGRANGLQRYRCRACGRTCNGLTGTPLARLRHKGRWLDYLGGMLASTSIRRASRYLGNYLGWRWALDGERIRTPAALLRAALGAGRLATFHT